MKTTISLLSLVMLLGLSGCSDPVPEEGNARKPLPKVALQPKDQLGEDLKKAMTLGTTEDLHADRLLVRKWRRGGEKREDRWPSCETVAKQFSGVSELKTLVGVQDALVAAQVDDYVLCDQPTIFASAKLAAEAAVKRLAADLPTAEAIEKLSTDPKVAKMDKCWLDSLRDSRQNKAPYDQTTERAEAKCTTK